MGPSIAIIGGGPAGLTLAKLLDSSPHTRDCYTVFEADESASSRVHSGGSLDLHVESGIAALQKAGLYAEFVKRARFGGAEDLIISDQNGKEWFRKISDTTDEQFDRDHLPEHARPEIDRTDLLEMLLHSVRDAVMCWNHKIASVSDDGILTFQSGRTAGPFDLVIGADGAWSKVRHVLTAPMPRYSGISGFQLRVLHGKERHPQVAQSIGRGNHFCYSNGASLTGQTLGDGSYTLGTWGRRPESWPEEVKQMSNNDPMQIKEAILDAYRGWCPEFRVWLQASEPSAAYQRGWGLFELPIEGDGPRWTHKQGFTLIGDAAHLMTPFAGEGVNVAMLDALELSTNIIAAFERASDQDVQSLDEAARAFEKGMFPRAHKVMKKTHRNKTMMFHSEGPEVFIKVMRQMMEAAGLPPDTQLPPEKAGEMIGDYLEKQRQGKAQQ
ncbi:putative monooxygenase fad-binding protein [Phaeomoniella chlamydospora]|uniref:Putative monooxygenase fad-binding protein n=1 Tax=Phaeomoniella chlamydospora TaxID=158046 RepID=A0A0G2E5T7_PHACM|nr:putative monooxygenase fad-binding protein [Phaeomoniella chlamydospora]